MKKLFYLLMLMPALAVAQDNTPRWPRPDLKCDFLRSDYDSYSGQYTLEAGVEGFKVQYITDSLYFVLTLPASSVMEQRNRTYIKKDTKLYLTLADQKVMPLTIYDVQNMQENSVVTMVITCSLSLDQITTLSNTEIAKYYINANSQKIEKEPSGRAARKLMDGSKCVKALVEYRQYKASQKK